MRTDKQSVAGSSGVNVRGIAASVRPDGGDEARNGSDKKEDVGRSIRREGTHQAGSSQFIAGLAWRRNLRQRGQAAFELPNHHLGPAGCGVSPTGR